MDGLLASQRITAQGLVDRRSTSPAEVAAWTCGIQAQDPQAARLGIRVRSHLVTERTVEQAIAQDRTVVKTSLMRATLHVVAAEDVRWLTALLGPAIVRKARKRWSDLGLTPDVLARTIEALPTVLAEGPCTRREIVAWLAELGIVIDDTDQAPAHVLLHATAMGLVCRGPDRGRDATFVLLDDWLPEAPLGPAGDDALAEIARRYFRAFSPATPADFTVWSGLPATRAIALIRDELTPVDVAGRAGYRLGEPAPGTGVHLLPAWDNYLVGYRDRDTVIDPAHRPHVYVGGVIKPTVLCDGRVVGTWRLEKASAAATVHVSLFAPLTKKARSRLDLEVHDIGRFLGKSTTALVSP